MEQKIVFSRIRDFGEIINDSIGFVKQNFKALFTPLLYICLFFILASIMTGILMQIRIVSMFGMTRSNIFTGATDGLFMGNVFGIDYLLNIIFYFLTYTVMQLVTLCYIFLYKSSGNVAPTKEAVWGLFKAHIFRFALISFLLLIIQVIAIALCIIPGIYFFPIASLIYVIVIMDDAGFDQAFGRAFTLIKDNWWKTFGALFIVSLITYFSVSIFALPGTIMTMSGLFFGESSSLMLMGAILNVIVQSFGMLLYTLPTITAAICYFSLSEEKEGTGLMERINTLGAAPEADTSHPDEEY